MRLIDADKLIGELHNMMWDFVRDDLQLQWNRAIYKAIETVLSQPTAYDEETVVRKLEEAKEGFFIRNGEIFRTIPFEKVIEILKAGEQHG